MSKPIGILLKEEGFITETMINYALKIQKSTGQRLGDALKSLKFVNDAEIATVLAKQANLPFRDLEGSTPVVSALAQIPYNFAKNHNVLAFGLEEDHLLIAIADPFDSDAISKIGLHTSLKTRLFVSSEYAIQNLIETFYYFADHPIDEEVAKFNTLIQQGKDFQIEKLVQLLTSAAIELSASDLHITSTGAVTLVAYRIDGILQLKYTLHNSIHNRLISAFKVASGMDIAELNRPQDGRITFSFLSNEYDLRVSCLPTTEGDNLVIRILSNDDDVKSLEQLGFLEEQLNTISSLAELPFGLVLITGPTGSGKSTSLYGILRKVNVMEKNVMTIEDPVEFKLPLARQVSVNEKAGITFASSIRSFLRQDPDVILIGEIRDEDTAQLGIRASQTGHLVLSTLHTNNSIGSIARLRDLGISNFLISSAVSAIISQRLLRRLCSHCKEPVSDHARNVLDIRGSQSNRHVAKGCPACNQSGYIGRVAAAEILIINDELRNLIDHDATPFEIKAEAEKLGFRSLYDIGLSLVNAGITDMEEIKRVLDENIDFDDPTDHQDNKHRKAA